MLRLSQVNCYVCMHTLPSLEMYLHHFMSFVTYQWAQYFRELHYTMLERSAREKRSSFLGPFVSLEENEVMWIRLLGRKGVHEYNKQHYFPGLVNLTCPINVMHASSSSSWLLSLSVSLCVCYQRTLKEEVSLYCWPPVWLILIQLYDSWQFSFLFAKQTNPNRSNRRSTVQRYFPFSVPWDCYNLH